MTFARSETFRSIGQILAADVLPALYRAQKLPLHHDHYYHECCMAISAEQGSPTYQDMTADA